MKQVNEPGKQWVGNDRLEDHAEAMDTSPMSDAGSVKTMLLEGRCQGASRSEGDQSSVGTIPEELGQAVLVEQAVLPGNGESFKAWWSSWMRREGGFGCFPKMMQQSSNLM